MIRLLFTTFALMLSVATASAAVCTYTNCWKGAGWYQIDSSADGGGIYAGPFADEAECKASLPADHDDIEFDCEYLETQPSWDKD